MRNFETLARNLPVATIVAELEQHPELWGAHPGRTLPDSPHYGVPDVWVRFRPADQLLASEDFKTPHFPAFYPAWELLPSLHNLVFQVMHMVPNAVMLGGILITKIPAGGRVKPHHDRGGWHAEFYNTKVYVPLQTNPECVNWCEDESKVMRIGEAVIFDNLRVHSVENKGTSDRITLIICLRVEGYEESV